MPQRARHAGRHRKLAPGARLASGTRAVQDSSEQFVPAEGWLAPDEAAAERLAEQIVRANEGVFRDMGVLAVPTRRKGTPGLRIETSTRIGAVPLLSPLTSRPDFGLVVEPRFTWASAGDMLAGTGFRVVPELLPLPDPPQSERRIPPWVLSSVVLKRVTALLDSLQRRFTMSVADLRFPRGHVDWSRYASTRFPTGHPLEVPCHFPDLRDDEELRAAIHWVVRRHRDALLGQRSHGLVVRHLLALCELLLARLAATQPRLPAPPARRAWSAGALLSRVFREGIQAIDWTAEERGLAGLSDLAGLAWRMDMEVFFEAWVEALAEHAARRTGASLRVGRREQTRVSLEWRPSSAGSQRALIPDVVLRRADVVLVFDAKYKRHAEQIDRMGWQNASAETREAHRNDVLQVLAYSTLFDGARVVACLVYPASAATWDGLVARRRTVVRARVPAGARTVELALLAVPLRGEARETIDDIADLVAAPVA